VLEHFFNAHDGAARQGRMQSPSTPSSLWSIIDSRSAAVELANALKWFESFD
jgi:hypothetical protein